MYKMSIMTITKQNYEKEVLQSKKPVLLDFTAQWCVPCHLIAPIIDEIAKERTDLKIGKVDIDQETELAQTFQVMSIPTLVVLKDGKVKNVLVGAQNKEAMLDMVDV